MLSFAKLSHQTGNFFNVPAHSYAPSLKTGKCQFLHTMLLSMSHNVFRSTTTLQFPSFSLRRSHRSTVVSEAQLPRLAQPRIRRKWEVEDCLLLYSSQYRQPCKMSTSVGSL